MCRSETSFLIVLMILARSLGEGSWVDELCVADIGLLSVNSSNQVWSQANGMIAWTFQSEAGPVVWNGLRTVSPKHVLLS